MLQCDLMIDAVAVVMNELMKRIVLSKNPCWCYHEAIVVVEHVAGVRSENDVESRAVVDNEREKHRVADVDSDVLISPRAVKHLT